MSTTLTETTIAATATTLLRGVAPPMATIGETLLKSHCPQCGSEVTSSVPAAQHRIQELEAQVKFLTTRAAETADRLADYEDEIRTLRDPSQNRAPTKESRSTSSEHGPSTIANTPPATTVALATESTQSSPPRPPEQPAPTSRLGTIASFLPYRRQAATTNTTAIQTATSGSPAGSDQQPPFSPNSSKPDMTSELQIELTREKSLRKAAESQLSQANSELEELTVQLFSQANEMVAQERKARAKLEERVAILERRDGEKRKRLERLEKAIERVERVRNLVS